MKRSQTTAILPMYRVFDSENKVWLSEIRTDENMPKIIWTEDWTKAKALNEEQVNFWVSSLNKQLGKVRYVHSMV